MKFMRARLHELRCRECRVSWRSWWDRVWHERPARGCICAEPLRIHEAPRPCPLHGWMGAESTER